MDNLMKKYVDKDGYEYVILTDKKGIKHKEYVHKLVAEQFIPNPNNYTKIRHIDGNIKNNCVWNLEWCSSEDYK